MLQLKFPNLFIIGAMKAGTSSLHEYLHQHPQIFMSRFKEPQYFAPHRTQYGMWGQGNPLPEPRVDWYLRLFDNAEKAKYAGESSVSYSARHWVSGCDQRIWEFNPGARIIYLMRDPVERAISHYWHFVAAGRETRGLLAALRTRDDYLARSDYAYQIEPYFRRFGADQVYCLTLEELQTDPEQTFRELFDWLGVASDVAIDATVRHNVSQRDLQQTRPGRHSFARFLNSWRWLRYKARVPRWVSGMLERLTYRHVDKSSVDLDGALEFLRSKLLHRLPALERLTRRSFPQWTTLQASKTAELATIAIAAEPLYASHIDCQW